MRGPRRIFDYFALLNFNTLTKSVLLILFALAGCLAVQSQSIEGGRGAALGGATVTLDDSWSVFHNQAGLVGLKGFTAGAFFQNRFLIKELGDRGIFTALPVNNGTFAFSYQNFGYSAFNQSRVGLAYALKLSEKFSVGVQLNYHSLRIAEGYGTARSFSAEGGFIYKMNEHLTIAGHLENANRARLASFNDERMPSVLRLGAHYAFSDKVKLIAQAQQVTEQKINVTGALEYDIAKSIVVRAAAGANPSLTSFGFGWKNEFLRADVAAAYHNTLGFTPQISLTYCAAGF